MTHGFVVPAGRILDRPAIGRLRERDIDLLICSELHAGGALAAFLAGRLEASGASFSGAWVSHAELDGENDLVVGFGTPDGEVLALIENKIDAAFQPDQAGRYRVRSTRWRQAPAVARVVTVLLAPESYMTRAEADAFEKRMTYEEVEEVLHCSADGRSAFLARVLREGIEAALLGYVMQPDEKASQLWRAIWNATLEIAPALRMKDPGPRPGGATFLHFHDALGLSGEARTRACVVYKFGHGFVDLQISNTSPDELVRRTRGILQAGMTIERTGKSASVRIAVPKLDPGLGSQAQADRIMEGVAAAERMRRFLKMHGDRLLGGT